MSSYPPVSAAKTVSARTGRTASGHQKTPSEYEVSRSLELPDWAQYMTDPPQVSAYAGPADQAVMWYGAMSRRRYQIVVDNQTVTLNVSQAHAIADMIKRDELGRPEVTHVRHGAGHCRECCAFPGDGPESFAEHDHDACRDALAEYGGATGA
jgi:hypothetical protein